MKKILYQVIDILSTGKITKEETLWAADIFFGGFFPALKKMNEACEKTLIGNVGILYKCNYALFLKTVQHILKSGDFKR